MQSLVELVFSNPIVAFIFLVGIVVFVHELGHYVVGRAMGIEVLEFSLGFGPRAFGFKRGNTDYRVSWLPLGGYVRFYGSDLGEEIPPEKKEKSIVSAKLYKRVLTSFAGPFSNFLLSIFIMTVLHNVGIPQAAPIITVTPDSVAESAGMKTGDKILSINDKKIESWRDLNKNIAPFAGKELRIEMERDGQPVNATVIPQTADTESPYGESVKTGRIGVTQFMQTPTVIVQSGSVAENLGFKTGDTIESINDKKVRYFHQLTYELEHPGDLQIKVKRKPVSSVNDLKKNEGQEMTLLVPANRKEFVVWSTDQTVGQFEVLNRGDARSKALDAWRQCGLSPGDTIVRLDKTPVSHVIQVFTWLEKVQKSLKPQGALIVNVGVVSLDGTSKSLSCHIPARETRDPLNRPIVIADVPIRFVTSGVPVEQILKKSDNIVQSFSDGFNSSWEQVEGISLGIKKLFTGSIPLASLGGPIAIARVAGDAAEGGLIVFFLTVSLMSINIGLFNLLPLPALDGGTLLLQGVEAAYGKPLPQKVQENVQRVGVLIIITLIVLVFYNDILRLFHS